MAQLMRKRVQPRFKIDLEFKSNEYSKLYKKWLDKSIDDKKTKVFINLIDNKIAGFITLEEEENCFNIGLLAVEEEFKGRGVAASLIKYCEYFTFEKGKNHIEVVTQGHNIPAIKFYKKNGFKINKIKYIHHYWNL